MSIEALRPGETGFTTLAPIAIDAAAEQLSAIIPLIPAAERGGPGWLAVEIEITVTNTGTDDLTYRVYPVPDGANRGFNGLAVEAGVLATSTAANVRFGKFYDILADKLGGAIVLGFTRTGATTDMVVTVKTRRWYRVHRQ